MDDTNNTAEDLNAYETPADDDRPMSNADAMAALLELLGDAGYAARGPVETPDGYTRIDNDTIRDAACEYNFVSPDGVVIWGPEDRSDGWFIGRTTDLTLNVPTAGLALFRELDDAVKAAPALIAAGLLVVEA